MKELLQWGYIVVYMIGLVACGLVRSSGGLDDDGGVDGAVIDSNAVPHLPASCVGLSMTCGVNGSDSCCNSLPVPGGMYFRSYDLAGDANSGNMNYSTTVSSFRLDKYEVTVGRFRKFVNAELGIQSNPPLTGTGAHANIVGSGWDANWNSNLVANTAALIAAVKCSATYQTWTDTPGADEDRPMNCITWYEAMAFCTWDSGYLPTEAEWNYAAAGGNQQRAYPWSNPAASLMVDGFHASYNAGMSMCIGDGQPTCTVADFVVVGSKPAGDGRWGHSDLGGNVSEWTLDWYANYAPLCTDCANLAPASVRSTRGGDAIDGIGLMRTAYRPGGPAGRIYNVGVRCARAP